ncbi:hypothetical protein [Cyclobacterium qasimii]|uniref:Uncharacterized protein n=2 Tax=Cyclobacterium qasimii TaxID=1350429 RepID=S7VB96_9BACT|nr:hypothetical protein [Cyclobacterium qasimii]EPR67226.1 hypothetical protein ADICYQ_3781 [Cyclobacterium qasimii M12-11B]GEO21572.1 hypothetical protein CQA01_21060 [Cyclobacterium qasimii]
MEKKQINRAIKPLLYFLFFTVFFGCKPKGEQAPPINNGALGDLKPTITPEAPTEGFYTLVKGDSSIQTIYMDGKRYFERLSIEGEQVYNHLYPEISDSFLFEDKYYLKLSYPIPFSGTIKTTIPESPDYVLTPIGEDILQVVVYNALDLKVINFNFDYIPSEKDSLISSTYPFKYVVYN